MFKSVSEFFNGSQGVTPTKEDGGYFLVMDSNLDLLMNMDSLKDKNRGKHNGLGCGFQMLKQLILMYEGNMKANQMCIYIIYNLYISLKTSFMYIQISYGIIHMTNQTMAINGSMKTTSGTTWLNHYQRFGKSTSMRTQCPQSKELSLSTNHIHPTPNMPLISFPNIWPVSNAFVRKVLGNHI